MRSYFIVMYLRQRPSNAVHSLKLQNLQIVQLITITFFHFMAFTFLSKYKTCFMFFHTKTNVFTPIIQDVKTLFKTYKGCLVYADVIILLCACVVYVHITLQNTHLFYQWQKMTANVPLSFNAKSRRLLSRRRTTRNWRFKESSRVK